MRAQRYSGAVGEVVGVAVGIYGAAVHRRVQRADPRIGVLLVGAEGATDNVLNFCVFALFGLVGFCCLGLCSREEEEKKNTSKKTESVKTAHLFIEGITCN